MTPPSKSSNKEATGMAYLVQRFNQRPNIRWLFWLGVVGLIILLGWLFSGYEGGFYQLPLATWVSDGVDWLIINLAVVFDGIKIATAVVLNNLEKFLLWLPWWSVLALIMLLAWRLASSRVAIFSGAAMYFIGTLGLWDLSMSTLALIATAVLISVILGMPLGILCALSDRVDGIVRPVLDAMQTMPAFVYLIPALMFFGIGKVPGVMATVIFALPPAVRLTNLGIRQVPVELVEAGHAFGSTSLQLLFKVQLPLALPSIMAGINQTIMLSLSMVVLAAMIAAGGLGREVLMALGQVDIGRGFVAGLAIVLVAMVLDRVTQALGRMKRRAKAA
jgi:glycine betaine/proline transport system permease protein